MPLINDITGMADEDLDKAQYGLMAAGMAPGGFVADLADAGISAGRGDLLGTILGLGAAIPGLGMIVGGSRLAKGAEKIVPAFFSRTARAAENLKRKRPFNDSAHMRKLLKEGGAPPEEMEFLGLQKPFSEGGIGEGRIELDELIDHISKNEIRVDEQWQSNIPEEILQAHQRPLNELKRRQRALVQEIDDIDVQLMPPHTYDEDPLKTILSYSDQIDHPKNARLAQSRAALKKELDEVRRLGREETEKIRLLEARHGPQAEHENLIAKGPHENYRELKLTWHGEPPGQGPSRFQSHNWEHDPETGRFAENIFAHVRVSDRYGPNGEKVLFIEEIQSDWHQKGKKFGYLGRKPPPPIKGLKPVRLGDLGKNARHVVSRALHGDAPLGSRPSLRDSYVIKIDPNSPDWQKARSRYQNDVNFGGNYPKTVIIDGDVFLVEDFRHTQLGQLDFRGTHVRGVQYNSSPEALLEDVNKFLRGGRPVPDAPFKEKWAEYAFKRILREASEGDYAHVAWNFGDDMKTVTGGKITGQKHFYDKVLPGIAKKFGKVSDLDIRGLGEGPDKVLDELVGAVMSAPQEELSRLVTKYAALTRHSEEEFLEMMSRYDKYGEQTLHEVIEEAFQKGWMKTEPRKSLRLSDDTKLSGGIRHHSLYEGFSKIAVGGVAASPLISKIADNDRVTMEEV